MTATLHIVHHRTYDGTEDCSDYTLIVHSYRPVDDTPYIPQGKLPHSLRSLRSVRLVDPGAYYRGPAACYIPFDAVFDADRPHHLAFGDGRWPAFSLAEPAARRLAQMTVADLFNVFVSPTASYYAARYYGVPQSFSDAFSYFSAIECRVVGGSQPLKVERITVNA